MRLIDELNDLHATYVHAINTAVAANDLALAEHLAESYDDDAIQLIAEREGKTHLLPIERPGVPETPLRRLVARLRHPQAA